MRAVTCVKYGPPEDLVILDNPSPQPGKGELVVAVKACGIQFSDTFTVAGKGLISTTKLNAYHGRDVQLIPPFTPGNEAAGVVKAVGEGVKSVKVGDRVLGTRLSGTFAEEVLFAEDEVCRIPDEMDFNTAACFYIGYYTAYYALISRGRLQRGETLLVLAAASGVGLAATEIARIVGARVIAAASSQERLALARRFGADELIEYSPQPLDLAAQKAFSEQIKQASGGNGPNVVLDLTGGTYAEPSMRAMAFRGRYLSVGFSAGVPTIPMHVIFNKNGELLGIEPGAGEDQRTPGHCPDTMRDLFDWYVQGKLSPLITDVLPIERIGEGLRRLLDRKAVGRIVMTMDA